MTETVTDLLILWLKPRSMPLVTSPLCILALPEKISRNSQAKTLKNKRHDA